MANAFFLNLKNPFVGFASPFFLVARLQKFTQKKKDKTLVTTLNTKKKLDLFYSYDLTLGDPAPTMVPWLKTPKFIEIIPKYYKYLMVRLIDGKI
jgi:hypothetical protein